MSHIIHIIELERFFSFFNFLYKTFRHQVCLQIASKSCRKANKIKDLFFLFLVPSVLFLLDNLETPYY